jgi:HTH-type transcriptional regulator/antitoxin HigA
MKVSKMAEQRPVEVFPPGEFLREELEERGWTQVDLAEILGRPAQLVNEIISGKRGITPETAKGLGAAFGTSAELWLNLEQAYKLWRLSDQTNDDVTRRAGIFSYAPISEMVKRGWISTSENVEVLEHNVTAFFETKTLDERPQFKYAARKSTPYTDETNTAQLAWLFRAKHLAKSIPTSAFTKTAASDAVSKLRQLLHGPKECRHVSRILSAAGIRFVVVQTLPTCKIDGSCFWLTPDAPVVALSMRYDRIDNFWFTLLHEMHHCIEGEESVDVDLTYGEAKPTKPECERKADDFAKSTIINQEALNTFIANTSPRFSRRNVDDFASSQGVHTGLVVGQLQRRGVVDYKNFRNALVQIRESVCESAVTDGWGITVRSVMNAPGNGR